MKTIALAVVMMFSLSALASDKGAVIQGTYGKTRIDNSFDFSVPTNDVFSLGAGYLWQPDRTYANGVMLNVSRYDSLGHSQGVQANATAYDLVYSAEWQVGPQSSPVVFIYDAGYSLLEAKVSGGGPESTSNGITGSAGFGYKLGQTGATMIFVEAQGARYFEAFDISGATVAIMSGNVGIRHRF